MLCRVLISLYPVVAVVIYHYIFDAPVINRLKKIVENFMPNMLFSMYVSTHSMFSEIESSIGEKILGEMSVVFTIACGWGISFDDLIETLTRNDMLLPDKVAPTQDAIHKKYFGECVLITENGATVIKNYVTDAGYREIYGLCVKENLGALPTLEEIKNISPDQK